MRSPCNRLRRPRDWHLPYRPEPAISAVPAWRDRRPRPTPSAERPLEPVLVEVAAQGAAKGGFHVSQVDRGGFRPRGDDGGFGRPAVSRARAARRRDVGRRRRDRRGGARGQPRRREGTRQVHRRAQQVRRRRRDLDGLRQRRAVRRLHLPLWRREPAAPPGDGRLQARLRLVLPGQHPWLSIRITSNGLPWSSCRRIRSTRRWKSCWPTSRPTPAR